MLILGIETSCDETAAAVVADGRDLLSNVVASQVADHKEFGGVVPEIASRKHMENIIGVISAALSKANVALGALEAIAVTFGPGLVGSLLIGLSTAKAIAYYQQLPLIGVNHLEGHIYALTLERELPFPFIAFIVSGGHTSLYLAEAHGKYQLLGRTLDDAVGEAFDKVAKTLGLGYPGGPIIDQLATAGNPTAINFPRSYLGKNSLDFSLSGIKTAVLYYVQRQRVNLDDSQWIKDIAASFQQAVVEVLVSKAVKAACYHRLSAIVLSGGVACNSALRQQLTTAATTAGIEVYYPNASLCTDNAAMIAACGYYRYCRGELADWGLDAVSVCPHF